MYSVPANTLFGPALKHLFGSNGNPNVGDVARKAGMRYDLLSKARNGSAPCPAMHVAPLARELNCDPKDLMAAWELTHAAGSGPWVSGKRSTRRSVKAPKKATKKAASRAASISPTYVAGLESKVDKLSKDLTALMKHLGIK